MPKNLTLSFPVFLLVASILLPASFVGAKSFGRVADVDGYTNMRTQPTKQGNVLAWVMNGSCVELVAMDRGWYKVTTVPATDTGFIYRKNLKVVESCAKPSEYTVPGKCDLALDALFRLEGWTALVTWEQSNHSCIDKEMKAAAGEWIARKLSLDWARQSALLGKEAVNSTFLSFVGSALATVGDKDALAAIQKSAQNSCTLQDKNWCISLANAASEGLKKR